MQCTVENRSWMINDALRWGEACLRDRGVGEHYIEATYLLSAILGCKRSDLFLKRDHVLSSHEKEIFLDAIERRSGGEPPQYITGSQEFRGLNFVVTKDVLIPRPETELVVEEVVRRLASWGDNPAMILDMCTGSGCIAVSVAKEVSSAKVYAVDISSGALDVARENAVYNGTAGSIEFLKGDLFSPLDTMGLDGEVDLVVSNPPYISEDMMETLPPEVGLFEPFGALFGGSDGLEFYRRIVAEAPVYLKEGGYLIMEIGYSQAGHVVDILKACGAFGGVQIRKDYAGIDRVVTTSRL